MSEPFEFEGDEVTDFTAQLPSATLQAPEAYQRGTLLTLTVQVRVKSVRIEEDRKGQLSRKHVLALEECTVTDVLTPAQRKALIEAAAAATVADAEPGDYTVAEESEIADFIPAPPEFEPDEENQCEVVDLDDDDADHSWMDDDDDETVHADLSLLV